MRIIGIIPARFGSTRFPGKPLAEIKGRPLLERVYIRAKRAAALDEVIIATDDLRIFEAAEAFGAKVVMTSKSCKSGTDRLAEVIKKYEKKAGIIVNIQGDEPLIEPSLINSIALSLKKEPKLQMSTAAGPINNTDESEDPNIVKVVLDKENFALYFSRSAIPYLRSKEKVNRLKHIGIYGYRREFLLKYSKWPQTKLERSEMLEQLRALENGCRIKVVISKYDSIGVDVPNDINKIEKRLANG